MHVWAWSQGGGAWCDRRTRGCNKHANRKPTKPGGSGGTSPSRRRSLHPVEHLGGAEDLQGGKESQIHHHKRRERISPVYRKPPGECKHVALATHSKAWRQELLPVISMLGETRLTQKTCTISPNKTGSDDLNESLLRKNHLVFKCPEKFFNRVVFDYP